MAEAGVGMTRYQIGVDIGGTFTDIVLLGSDGRLHTRKTLSTPEDYGLGIVQGIQSAMSELGIDPRRVERVVHATTVATNAILEHRGSNVGLITTRGFRDVLEMRRLRIPEMYALNYPSPTPLVPRQLRLELDGRMGPRGEEWEPLDESGLDALINRLTEARVEAVAVCLLHAYANPGHEQRVAARLRERMASSVFVTCSSDILPVIREYERTSTTVINAFLGPTLTRYFQSLQRHLRAIGIDAPLQVMKSDGGIMSVEAAIQKPAYLIESGPAAGVIGAARLGELMQLPDSISFDMGGTTAKASMVEAGEVSRTPDYEVGAGINLSSKLVMGGGYALKLPVIDISEIGAGGGSLVSVDAGGLVRVGPRSAGSSPGPVAYDLGGEDPTFTDAVIALGYLNPDHLVGGGLRLNPGKARAVLEAKVARPIGQDLLRAAFGVFEVACGTMTRAVKAISTYRGRDPRDFTLFAFGGNGPVVATQLATMLEMRKVVIPPNPGVFSAFGLLMSNVEHEAARSFMAGLDTLDVGRLARTYRSLEDEVLTAVGRESTAGERPTFVYLADLRYAGQAHELTVSVPTAANAVPDLAAMTEAFATEHERTYGHRSDTEAVEVVTVRVIARVAVQQIDWQRVLTPAAASAATKTVAANRLAYFGMTQGQIDTPVVARRDLIGGRAGPLIIEEYDSTVVVPPGWHARVDALGTIYLEGETN